MSVRTPIYMQLCMYRVCALPELHKIVHELLVKIRDTLHMLGV